MSSRFIFELWADSFKEGEMIVDMLINGGDGLKLINVEYEYNFKPIFYLKGKNDEDLIFHVFGNYGAWNNPPAIKKFLDLSRPDVMLYCPEQDKIILAIEETAAVPTGNQSLQRLERVWWSAHLGIPFVYLISEYGLHKDGNARKNSIWPAYLCLKLSAQYKIPSLVLLYGDKEHCEDYSYGKGWDELSKLVLLLILQEVGKNVSTELNEWYRSTVKDMNLFILGHKENISLSLPGGDFLGKNDFIEYLMLSITKN